MKNLTLYAYLNIDHPMVAWEVAIGRVRSVCDRNSESFGVSLWQYSLLSSYVTEGTSNKFLNELLLEQVRQNIFPSCVSRLSGVFFFKDKDTALAAIERWRLPKSRSQYITPVNFSATTITELDSEWITSFLKSKPTNLEWMTNYWSGKTLGENPLVECIASGIGLVQDMELRELAYKKIMEKWPTSTPLLAVAACGFGIAKMEDIGLMRAALISEEEDLKGSFWVNINDINNRAKELIEVMKYARSQNIIPPMIRHENPGIYFSVPDFRDFEFSLRNKTASSIFSSIHPAAGVAHSGTSTT